MSVMSTIGRDLYEGKRSFDFVHNWKRSLGVGLILCLLSVIILLVKPLHQGIDFRGGAEFRITQVSDVSTGIGVDAATKQDFISEPPRASVVGTDSIRIQTQLITDAQTDELKQILADAYKVDVGNVTSSFVGPSWGEDVTNKSFLALAIFLSLVAVLIAAYFRAVATAAAALIALGHDLLITAGVYAATGFEVTPATVIGFLTILGYSLYDTVVVFDKVRENTVGYAKQDKKTYAELVNLAVNQTLVRSVNTSIVALLPVGSILFIGYVILGAGTLRDIALSLFVGMLVGTYSSVFVAPSALVLMRNRVPKIAAHTKRVLGLRDGSIVDDEDDLENRVKPSKRAPAGPGKQRQQPKRK